MNRKQFLFLTALSLGAAKKGYTREGIKPEMHYFKDDGMVPNSQYPLLLYKNVFSERGEVGADWLERHFLSNNWHNSWRNGIFTFQHYHSITHEVLGIYSGEALVLLGGDQGTKLGVQAGDIIVIPAGVGHKNLEEKNLGVVGAYPDGMPVDILRAQPGDRPQADHNIAAVPIPGTDPFLGKNEGLIRCWKKEKQ